MDNPSNQYGAASQNYTYRVPSPPRIFIPPPVQSSIDVPSTHLEQMIIQPCASLSNISFLSAGTVDLKVPINDGSFWSYKDRQSAQAILPWLFLGPLAAARDREFLQSNHITMVVCIRRSAGGMMISPKAPRELGLEMHFIDTATPGELIGSFNRLVTIINEHMERLYQQWKLQHVGDSAPPGRVLVFCESGNENSATAVAAYILAVYNLGVVRSIQLVQGHRFSINIDNYSRHKLETYETLLKAQQDIASANQAQQQQSSLEPYTSLEVPNGRRSRKRSVDRIFEGEDINMEDDWVEVGYDRAGSAPFRDNDLDEDE